VSWSVLKDRTTADVVVLILAATLGAALLLAAASIFVLSVVRGPGDLGVSAAAQSLADLLSVLAGIVTGYVAGRTSTPAPSVMRKPTDDGTA
jgi:hypothetical protein